MFYCKSFDGYVPESQSAVCAGISHGCSDGAAEPATASGSSSSGMPSSSPENVKCPL